MRGGPLDWGFGEGPITPHLIKAPCTEMLHEVMYLDESFGTTYR